MTALDLPAGGRRYLQIARLLADQIDNGVYSTGQKLPPERDLAHTMGVSRTTVREALLALEIMRFIEIRLGSGVVVLPEHLRDQSRGDLMNSEEIGPYQVLEVRRAIEGLSAYHAASRATPEQIDALAVIVDRMEASIDAVTAFDHADEEYHARLAEACGNELVEAYVSNLWRMRRSSLWNRWYDQTRNAANRRQSVRDHRQIIKALQRRRPEAAMAAMQAHIDILTDRFLDLQL